VAIHDYYGHMRRRLQNVPADNGTEAGHSQPPRPARRAHQGAELLREEALEAVGLGDQRVRVGLDQHDEAHYRAPDPSCVTSSISAPDGASARSPSSFVRPGDA